MKQLGILDSAFINLEQFNTPQHIGGFGIYDVSTTHNGAVDKDTLMQHVLRRLQKMHIFKTRLQQVPWGLDKPYWVDDEKFDSEYHLRHITLDAPNDWNQLCAQIANLHAEPLDMKKPLWECYVIQGLDNIEGVAKGGFAIYSKMHHSMIDGSGVESFMTALHDLEAYPENPPQNDQENAVAADSLSQAQPVIASEDIGAMTLLSKAFVNNSKASFSLTRQGYKVAADLYRTVRDIKQQTLPAYPQNTPKSRFDNPVGPQRVFDAAQFELDDFKKIRRHSGATINDIAVCVVGGALRKYLQHHGELLNESLIGTMPVNIRKMGDDCEDNNQISTIMAAIHTHIEEPLQRLQAVTESMLEAKAFVDTPLAHPMKLAGVLPPGISKAMSRWYVDKQITRKLPLGTCGVITNVMGPDFPLFACGARLSQYHCLGLLTPGGALFHAVFSMNGRVSISALSDKNIMPDPAFYRECINSSFADLLAAVTVQDFSLQTVNDQV